MENGCIFVKASREKLCVLKLKSSVLKQLDSKHCKNFNSWNNTIMQSLKVFTSKYSHLAMVNNFLCAAGVENSANLSIFLVYNVHIDRVIEVHRQANSF